MRCIVKQALKQTNRHLALQCRDVSLRLTGAYQNKQSVSLCTTVKNRLQHLQKTVLRNLEDNKSYPNLELLVLNYNCSDPRTDGWIEKELGAFIESGKVSYYRYESSDSFERAHAKNLAFRLAKGDLLCNVDADNYTGKGFAHFLSAQLSDGKSYVAGPRDGRGLGGRIGLRREHFEQTGGYDERIANWGGDDHDFSSRLDLLPLIRRPVFKPRHLRAIQHSDELRMTYSNTKDKWASAKLIGRIREQNLSNQCVNPNGNVFGCGRVIRNFSEWITVEALNSYS